jgi:Predicted transcriptional regulators containing the CopG/Arc/MetJ DNA-binding domain and a metal-binding domain
MEVISLSIDDKTLDKIEEINESASFNGRSELIRKAIENLHQETSDREKLEGELNAVIIARHSHSKEQKIAEIAHKFDNILTTQLHSKLTNDKCLEVFHTTGSADRVIEFYNKLEGSKNTESVNILPQD